MRKNPKIIELVVLIVLIATSLPLFLNKKEANSPQTEAMMVEVLPNGEQKIVHSLQKDNAYIEKEEQLKSFTAQQTKLDVASIAVSLKLATSHEDKGPQFMSCSIVLDTTDIIEKQIIHAIKSEAQAIFNIAEDDITITNRAGVLLD